MCGVVGIVNLDGRAVDRDILTAMARALRHRGPDEAGSFVDRGVGLAHTRLAIVDRTHGQQPMCDDTAAIVFNGEIYNYRELRSELIARGHRFRTDSDTEVLLRAYAEYGIESVTRLNGVFAFVLYDRARQRIVVARDHLGVKPMYYHARDRHLVFASEVKALLQHPDVPPAVDHDGLRDYLTFQFTLGAGTMFDGIHKVLPGHLHVFDLPTGREQIVRYWTPTFSVDTERSEESFLEELRVLLADAVRIQSRTDAPMGAYLSGGLDSSAVTALASRAGASLTAFTARFAEGPEFDESCYARRVAADCRVPLLEVVGTDRDFIELLPTIVYYMDEPAAGPGVFPQFLVSRLAADHVKVALGGQGGDELFGGYARYLVAYLERAIKAAITGPDGSEDEDIIPLESMLPNLPTLQQYVPMIRRFWRQNVFESGDRRYFDLIDRSAGAISHLTADFRATYRKEEIFERFRAVFNRPDTRSYFNKMTHFDLVSSLPALLHVEDRAAMASSLESRVPLLDPRIVDLVGTMPVPTKFRAAELKYALKRAVADVVPAEILARQDKMGFPVPLHLWSKGPVREFFADILLSERCRTRGIFDRREVERLLGTEAAFGRQLWGMVNLELWHRQFIDAS